jgi:hypothetical protein
VPSAARTVRFCEARKHGAVNDGEVKNTSSGTTQTPVFIRALELHKEIKAELAKIGAANHLGAMIGGGLECHKVWGYNIFCVVTDQGGIIETAGAQSQAVRVMAGLGLPDQKSTAHRNHAHRHRLHNLY